MLKKAIIAICLLVAQQSAASDCRSLEAEYTRYDSDRTRLELSGIADDSAIREQVRVQKISIIMQRQAMVLDLIIASGCDLPAPPKPFSQRGSLCGTSPQACRDLTSD